MPHIEKYKTDDPDFDETHGVLRNLLDILDPAELERRENAALIAAYDRAALSYSETDSFTCDNVCNLHRLFLGGIFKWAGEYRQVDVSSDDIRWCHARHIHAEMGRYGQRLARLTPFQPSLSRKELLSRLAELHGELIVIHPFRDGNGRTARLLGDLLLMQTERPPIQFGTFDDQKIRREYHAAIRDVWAKADYRRLTALLDQLIS
ncbi:MAG: hypothetical protein A3G18_04420 [Rhodospirillales bacterium RIFCSPLOWO2_12_FULL_58_28]|nr:MAG: hypothetical protein A3H92_09775 [Rhodospirillales bacterium RIFCSPLOWO2_02_FULL_58_16]OHC76892.1 MAG: hypothetical protein A3G18_04420 [Rhodospirillales bacterium RIFCSPLOWO2_12_FULL_58_28]